MTDDIDAYLKRLGRLRAKVNSILWKPILDEIFDKPEIAGKDLKKQFWDSVDSKEKE